MALDEIIACDIYTVVCRCHENGFICKQELTFKLTSLLATNKLLVYNLPLQVQLNTRLI